MGRDYGEAAGRIRAVCEGEDDAVALMATVACELYHAFDDFDWVGFYRVTAPDLLKIGPYQGGHGCLVIPFARGVCGLPGTDTNCECQLSRKNDRSGWPPQVSTLQVIIAS